jgi:protoporphyrinogen oxidase
LRSCGLREAGRIGLELAHERLRRRPSHSLEDFAVSRFGETLSRRILLNYSEKLWGLKAAELSPDAATRRLKGLSLSSLVAEVMSSTHKTGHLDGSFLYPRQGYGRICEALEQGLPQGALRAQRDVVGLRCRRDRVTRIEFANGDAMAPAGRILSTLPLTALVSLLGEALPQAAHDSAAALRFRHLRLVFLRLDQPRVSDNASIYVPDLHLCLSRIYEPRNRSTAMAPPGETALVVEVPCFRDDAVGRMGEAAVAERVIDELVQLRLIERRRVIEWKHHFVANAYPVYSRGYADHVSTIRAALAPIGNLDTLGRAGQFVYSHLHDQLRYAKDYVRALTQAGDAPAPIAC